MEANQKFILKLEYEKPIPIENIATMFKALDDDFKYFIKKNPPVNPNAEVTLAIKEINKGSQIYELIPVIGATLFPYLNGESLYQYACLLKQVYDVYIKKPQNTVTYNGNYTKKDIENKSNILSPVVENGGVSLIIYANNSDNQTVNINLGKNDAKTIYDNITSDVTEITDFQELELVNKKLKIYQVRDTAQDKWDKGIIEELYNKPVSITCTSEEIKKKLLSFSANIFNGYFKINGKALLENGTIKGYKIEEIIDFEEIIQER